MKTAVLEPLPPALEKILATLQATTDITQYNKVIIRSCRTIFIKENNNGFEILSFSHKMLSIFPSKTIVPYHTTSVF